MMIRRAAAVAGAVGVLLATAAVPAAAVEPPDIPGIPLTTPDDPNPAPSVPMVQKTACATSATLAGSEFTRATPANVAFGVENLHRYATGKGITVAVVDSGVSPGVRLPRLTGGGDYITTTNGLEDCDHHGTLVAGIIGAAPPAPTVSSASLRTRRSCPSVRHRRRTSPPTKAPTPRLVDRRPWRPWPAVSCELRTPTST
ncbi:hypothetical protein GCM10020255_026170 [Rhodococcus baikonurensis]